MEWICLFRTLQKKATKNVNDTEHCSHASLAEQSTVVNSFETNSFLNALRRFITRRGLVRKIGSDNGTNFVGTTRELHEAMEEMDHNEITEKLRQQQIDWKFNPPLASYMGGVWE